MWIESSDDQPEDGDHVLVSCPWVGMFRKKETTVRLALFMKTYRDDNGRFASNGWFNEYTGEMIGGVEKWHKIPEGAI